MTQDQRPHLEHTFASELGLALTVPYPLVFVRAAEEDVLVRQICGIGVRIQSQVWTWSSVRGLALAEAVVSHALPRSPPAHADLLIALTEIAATSHRAIFVLLEPGPFLERPMVKRALSELVPILEQRGQSIVVIGNLVAVPAELTHDATVLDAPLPPRKVLVGVLDEVLLPTDYPLLPRERMVAAALGLTRRQAARAFARARMHFETAQKPARFDWEGTVLEEKRRTLGRDDVVEFVNVTEGLDAVGGVEDLKVWLETRKAAFTEEARQFGLPVPRGLLLAGVQGCGKSLVAKAVARHWGLPLLRLDLGSIFGGVLPPDAALRRALLVAETLAPSVLWTDEIEKGFTADSDGTTQRVLGTLLTWLQENQSEVFFVATANDVANLSPELLRKGRFDELFFVDLPDVQARAQVFTIHLRKRGRTPGDFDLHALSSATAHFSGAELEQVVIAGLYEAFADGRELRTDDMMGVIEETVPLYATHEEAIKALREWGRHRARFAARDRMLVDFFDA